MTRFKGDKDIVPTRTHKVCGKCKLDKELTAFGLSSTSRDGRRSRCTECRSRYDCKEKALRSQRQRERYDEGKRFVDDLKTKGSCIDCKQKFHPVCMQFHHRDPATKIKAVAEMLSHSRETLEAEIAKCDLICANCHLLRTYGG